MTITQPGKLRDSGRREERAPAAKAGARDNRCGLPNYGINTVSMTWMTPFDWYTFGIVTVETFPFSSLI